MAITDRLVFTDAYDYWITHQDQDSLANGQEYNNPADDWNGHGRPPYADGDPDDTIVTYTTIVVDNPDAQLRKTKFILVSELPDFYSDSELSTAYHSKAEYQNANAKYGYIYKSVKFSNAANVDDLFAYAKDWMKNNYHGGLTSFTITALDMHMLGYNTDKLSVGDRVNIEYVDPDTRAEIAVTFTVISIEYDLHDPDKTSYQIGIPDLTLNKTYGENKKGGGGGGGGNPDPKETDTDPEEETQTNWWQTLQSALEERWPMWIKNLNNGTTDVTDLNTPLGNNPLSSYLYNTVSDMVKAGKIQASSATLSKLQSGNLSVTGLLEALRTQLGDAIVKNLDLKGGLTFNGSNINLTSLTIDGVVHQVLGVSVAP